MGRSVRKGPDLRDLCARVEAEDGVDPRRERRRDDSAWSTRRARADAELAVMVGRIVDDVMSERSQNAARVIGAHVIGRGVHVIVVVEGVCVRTDQVASAARDQLARRLNRARVASISVRCVGIGAAPEPVQHGEKGERGGATQETEDES